MPAAWMRKPRRFRRWGFPILKPISRFWSPSAADSIVVDIAESLDSTMLKNRSGALLAQARAKNAPRRFVLESRLLEVLLQIAVLRVGESGYHTAEMRIDDLLAFLRERYGLYIDQLPPGEGFGAPSIDDRKALRTNVQARFTARLREIGFYRDLSDAYVTQTVVPRYTIPEQGAGACAPARPPEGALVLPRADVAQRQEGSPVTQGLRELTSMELNVARESVLLPRLVAVLGQREAGHCMRVTDLDRDLMVRLCGGLRSRAPGATVVVLADDALRQTAPDIAVSSTKLVELRNPLPNDELRPPLLVFVPNDLRASARILSVLPLLRNYQSTAPMAS